MGYLNISSCSLKFDKFFSFKSKNDLKKKCWDYSFQKLPSSAFLIIIPGWFIWRVCKSNDFLNIRAPKKPS